MTNIDTLLTDHLDLWTSAIARKSSAGRGRSKKFRLHGIDKLRALILDLAVHGKLVPQDPKDETSSELLRRVTGWKPQAKTIIGKSGTKPPSTPPQWICTHFGAVFALEYGSNLPDAKRSQSGEFPVFGSNGVVGSHYESNVDGPCIIVGRKGSAGAVNISLADGSWVTDVAYYSRPPKGVDIHFAYTLFNTLGLDTLGKGIKPGLNRSEAYALWITIPPLAEQRRIVAKVGELMVLCDQLEAETYDAIEAHQLLVSELLATLVASHDAAELAENWARIETYFDTLFVNEESVDQLKQTILQLAVMGKLSRQLNDDERSNQLALRADDQAEVFDLTSFHARARLFPLPEGWRMQPLSRVCTNIVDCPHSTPKWTESGRICVKSDQVKPGFLDLTLPNYVSDETFIERIERLEPKENDILFKREGGILGVAARIPSNTPLCLGQRLMLVRATDAIQPEFLELVLNSKWITEFALEKTTGGAAPRVNMAIVRAFPIPVPPLSEQVRIIAKVGELMELCYAYQSLAKKVAYQQLKISDTLVAKAVT